MNIEQKTEIAEKIFDLLKTRTTTLEEAYQVSSNVSKTIMLKMVEIGGNQSIEEACK